MVHPNLLEVRRGDVELVSHMLKRSGPGKPFRDLVIVRMILLRKPRMHVGVDISSAPFILVGTHIMAK